MMAAPGTRRILIVIARQVRDLEGNALVAHHLRRCGAHDVRLCSVDDLCSTMLSWAPDLVVLDALVWADRADTVRLARQLGMRVAVLPVAGFFLDPEMHLRSAGHATGVSQLVDCYLAWGTEGRDAIIARGAMPADRVHTVGCPRFDLYAEPYLALMGTRADFVRRLGYGDPARPLVIWATGTPELTCTPADVLRHWVGEGNITEAEVRADLEDQVTQFDDQSTTVAELARRHPDWTFVIKVHPVESPQPYGAIVDAAPNVHLAPPLPIREFLHHGDVLLQRGSTTSTEAWMLGKPVLELSIARYHRQHSELYQRCNHPVASIDEADRTIIAYLDGLPVPDDQAAARAEFIAQAYYRVDGRSSERAAALLHALVVPPAYRDEDAARTRALAAAAYAAHRTASDARLPNRVKDTLRIPRDTSLRFWKRRARDARGRHGEPALSEAAVAQLYRRYDAVMPDAPAAAASVEAG